MIVGGMLTKVNEYPWQMGLVDPSGTRPYCCGSILSNKTILTAAHCTDGTPASSITVLVAEHDWTAEDGQERFVVCGKTEHPA
jgi:trypsin